MHTASGVKYRYYPKQIPVFETQPYHDDDWQRADVSKIPARSLSSRFNQSTDLNQAQAGIETSSERQTCRPESVERMQVERFYLVSGPLGFAQELE